MSPKTTKQETSEVKQFDNLILANAEELKSLDWALGKKLAADNTELAKDLFNMLIKNLPKEQILINTAYKNNNFEDLKIYVHKLHGGCCYVGVPKLKYLAKNLELSIISKRSDQINTLLNELNQEITYLMRTNVNNIV